MTNDTEAQIAIGAALSYWRKADNEWQDLLCREYGAAGFSIRYDEKLNAATPALAEHRERCEAAKADFQYIWDKYR